MTCTASTFGADVGRPLSRVASPERYVGLRVSRGELLLRRPPDYMKRGLWRSSSNGVFSCANHYTGTHPGHLVGLCDLFALFLFADRRPQKRLRFEGCK